MLEKGLVVDFEVFIENPRFVSLGSIVEFQNTDIKVTKIDLVVPQGKSVLIRGTGKVIKDKSVDKGHACDDCNGSGGDTHVICRTCRGTGWIK
jgi:hypothetical protein